METSFWHQKWERNEIAFHQKEANPLLVKYFKRAFSSKRQPCICTVLRQDA
jgi:hypothetical protein